MFAKRSRIIVSAYHRLVYVRIPKAANTSIRRALVDGRHERVPVEQLEKRFPGYLSFTFVRNPWARLVSTFSEKIRDGGVNDDHFTAGVHRNFVERGYPFRAGMPFREFAEFVCSLSDADTEKHLRSQAHFVVRKGAVIPAFVGRVESIRADWEALCERVGAPIELAHRKQSKRGRYEDYYDGALRDLVGERYREDVEIFAYRFGA